MNRLIALTLLFATAGGAQFVEIEVDAGARRGEIGALFGMDAPADERQARLLLDRETELPLRIGSMAAMAEELGALPGARPGTPSDRLAALPSLDDPLAQAVVLTATAIEQADAENAAEFHASQAWFDSRGEPLPALLALELGARLAATPRRLLLRAQSGQQILGLAGASGGGDTVQLLLVRQTPGEDDPPQAASFVAHVRNLPWGDAEFAIERWRLDATHPAELVSQGGGRGGMARISAQLPAPAVELIVLRKQDARPASGIIRRRVRPRSSQSGPVR